MTSFYFYVKPILNDQLLLLCETNLELIRSTIERTKPETVIIDSIQTMYNEEVSSAPGSVSQVRESTGVLMQIAKGMGISRTKPETVIIDSIQTMYNEEVSSAPGSVSQVRESTGVLMQIAKGMGISMFIVGHVTKDGSVAGPRVLEHMVDTVLYFEGDRQVAYRILRSVKNRFGSTNEIGVFEMQEKGIGAHGRYCAVF